jgi:hypothetical protein
LRQRHGLGTQHRQQFEVAILDGFIPKARAMPQKHENKQVALQKTRESPVAKRNKTYNSSSIMFDSFITGWLGGRDAGA